MLTKSVVSATVPRIEHLSLLRLLDRSYVCDFSLLIEIKKFMFFVKLEFPESRSLIRIFAQFSRYRLSFYFILISTQTFNLKFCYFRFFSLHLLLISFFRISLIIYHYILHSLHPMKRSLSDLRFSRIWIRLSWKRIRRNCILFEMNCQTFFLI